MNSGLISYLRRGTNQLLAYCYSIAFVLIGGRIVLLLQQAYGLFWPCDYVAAWWQVQRSTPTAMACSDAGRELTVVFGTAIAFGIVLTLVRNLQWRLQLVACVVALYCFLRLGYLFNALGREPAMAALSNALFITRLEIAGLALFALLVWLIHRIPNRRQAIWLGIGLALTGALAVELIYPSGGHDASFWKALGSTVLMTLVCVVLGYLPVKTARWLNVGS